jgi:HlyD family secretion protein
MKTGLILVAALGVAAALVYVVFLLPASREDGATLRVSGTIEVTDAEGSFRIPGRVEARLVSEGESVKAGQVVARLDAAELTRETALRAAERKEARALLAELEAGSRPAEIAEAEALASQAEALLKDLLAGSRPQEVAAAAAAVQRAQADVDRLKDEFDRQEKLFQSAVISTREFDATRTSFAAARARLAEEEERLALVKEGPRAEEIEAARAALRGAQERLALVREGPRAEDVEQARARVERAGEAHALAEVRLGYAVLASPLDGIVLADHIEPGEFVAAGTPIVTVGDLANVWLRAYINETDLGRVKVGQQARVTTDTFPGKAYGGRISFIASQAEFTPKNVQTERERVKLVYRIKVDIPNPDQELKPGMPADAAIALDETK